MTPPTTTNADAPTRLVVVLSGRGRNLEAILEAIEHGRLHARVALVVSNRPSAGGLRIARHAGLPCVVLNPSGFGDRESYDRALAARVAAEQPDFVVLAGYMRILSSVFVQQFQGRLVNIHPSLLPRYRGLHTHERALDNGDTRHGASIHFVIDDLDAGPLIRQGSIAVRADDTADTLADRLMQRVEQQLYPAALAELTNGRVQWHNGRVWRDGQLQEHCPHADYDSLAPV